jgi:hypothetical protein
MGVGWGGYEGETRVVWRLRSHPQLLFQKEKLRGHDRREGGREGEGCGRHPPWDSTNARQIGRWCRERERARASSGDAWPTLPDKEVV